MSSLQIITTFTHFDRGVLIKKYNNNKNERELLGQNLIKLKRERM